jgi:hypothetical protein
MDPVLQANLARFEQFRAWAYARSPEFGRGIDALVSQGLGAGEVNDLQSWFTDTLAKIGQGIGAVAAQTPVTIQAAYDAQVQVRNMQMANASNLTYAQYMARVAPAQQQGAENQANRQAGTLTKDQIEQFLLFGGAALLAVVLLQK